MRRRDLGVLLPRLVVLVLLAATVAWAVLPGSPLPGAAQTVLLGVLSTTLTAVLLYAVLRPSIELGDKVRTRPAPAPPSKEQLARFGRADRVRTPPSAPARLYDVRYRGRGPFPLFGVRVAAWIAVPVRQAPGPTVALPVPLSRPDLPSLRLFSARTWQSTRLVVDELDWPAHIPPDLWPTDLQDLRSILQEHDAHLHVHISAATRIFQVTGATSRVYGWRDVEAAPGRR